MARNDQFSGVSRRGGYRLSGFGIISRISPVQTQLLPDFSQQTVYIDGFGDKIVEALAERTLLVLFETLAENAIIRVWASSVRARSCCRASKPLRWGITRSIRIRSGFC